MMMQSRVNLKSHLDLNLLQRKSRKTSKKIDKIERIIGYDLILASVVWAFTMCNCIHMAASSPSNARGPASTPS